MERDLRVTDPGLVLVFAAFSGVTRGQGKPPVEQLAHGAD
jgi:hypothetical protein